MEEDWDGENEPENHQQQPEMEEDDDDEVEEEDILGGDDGPTTNDKESLLMRFCPHDSSMLYPQVSDTCVFSRKSLRVLLEVVRASIQTALTRDGLPMLHVLTLLSGGQTQSKSAICL
jgi:hypothetical protein